MQNFERADWVKGLNPARNEVQEGYFLHLDMEGRAVVGIYHDVHFWGSQARIPLDALSRCEPPIDYQPERVFAYGEFVEWTDPAGEHCEGWFVQYMRHHMEGMVTHLHSGATDVLPIEMIELSPKDPPSVKLRTRGGIGGTRVRSIPPLEPGDAVGWSPARDTNFKGIFRNASCLSWAWVTRDDGHMVYAYIEKLRYLG